MLPPGTHLVPRAADELLISGERQIRLPGSVVDLMTERHVGELHARLMYCVDETGKTTKVDILSGTGYEAADQNLVDKMKKWRFRPYMHDGQPAPFCAPNFVRYVTGDASPAPLPPSKLGLHCVPTTPAPGTHWESVRCFVTAELCEDFVRTGAEPGLLAEGARCQVVNALHCFNTADQKPPQLCYLTRAECDEARTAAGRETCVHAGVDP